MSILGIEEVKDYKTTSRQLFAEFIGTFLYLSLCLLAETIRNGVVVIALANGLLVASVIQIIGRISGGHINPAVTIGVLTCGRMKVIKAILYIITQILGALLGSGVSYYLTDSSSRGNLGATIPYEKLSASQVLGLEMIMSFILVSVVLTVVDKNGLKSLGPLAIGLSITACQCCAVTYSGSLNPVRSLGPAVVMNVWTHHWVYWIAPVLGGVLAGLVNKFILHVNFSNITMVDD